MREFADTTWLVLGGAGNASAAPLVALGMPSAGLRHPHRFPDSGSASMQVLPLCLIFTLLVTVAATARLRSGKRAPKSRR